MNFALDPELVDLRDRVAAFVRDEVIPAESQPFTPELVASLRSQARTAGIFGPQLPREYGGLGLGTVALTKAVLPSMLARRRGHIVPISSVIGYVGVPLRSAYAASKHALHGFFDALRAEVRKDGIDVTIVCPGYIRTNVSENALRGDGSRYGKLDDTHRKAMLPEVAAPKIIDGVYRRTREVYVGGKEIAAIYLQRWLPAVVGRVLRMK